MFSRILAFNHEMPAAVAFIVTTKVSADIAELPLQGPDHPWLKTLSLHFHFWSCNVLRKGGMKGLKKNNKNSQAQ